MIWKGEISMCKIYEIIKDQLIKLNEEARTYEYKAKEYEEFAQTYRARFRRAKEEIDELEEALKKLGKGNKLRKVA